MTARRQGRLADALPARQRRIRSFLGWASLVGSHGRHRGVAGYPGWNELVSALLQPAHGPVLRADLGEFGRRSAKYDAGEWKEGQRYTGSSPPANATSLPTTAAPARGRPARPTAEFRKEEEGYGAIRALDPKTGEKKWDFKMVNFTESGVLSTAGDLVFGGGMEGNFVALDARTGELLWHVNLGGPNASGPISYAVDGKHTSSAPARARCSCSQCRSDQKR